MTKMTEMTETNKQNDLMVYLQGTELYKQLDQHMKEELPSVIDDVKADEHPHIALTLQRRIFEEQSIELEMSIDEWFNQEGCSMLMILMSKYYNEHREMIEFLEDNVKDNKSKDARLYVLEWFIDTISHHLCFEVQKDILASRTLTLS